METDQLLAAILDAQNRCNNLLGALFNEMRKEAQPKAAQQNALANWKSANKELSQRCGVAVETLNTIFEAYLCCMLDHLDDIEDTSNEFQVREFLDKYGQGFVQLSSMIQTVSQLST